MSKRLVVAAVNGWSASSRKKSTRTSALVKRQIQELELVCTDFMSMKASFFLPHSRALRKFIRDHQGSGRTLVLVGKSFGAKVVVEKGLNPIVEKLTYDGIYLITVDPNWPETWDLTPNLNRRTLRLGKPITGAVNVYFATNKTRKQAGAMLIGPGGTPVKNIPLTDCDHYSIVQHNVTKHVIRTTLREASK